MSEGHRNKSWELNPKHVFILSSSGKPVFTRNGDEQEQVTTFGLLQAIASIVQDSGDELLSISAGNRKIVYFMRGSLYFVSISSTGEVDAALYNQLEFIHSQILMILTSKIHSVLIQNPAKDIRELLGLDSMRLLQTSCKHEGTSQYITFNAIPGFVCTTDLREELTVHLKNCIGLSGAVLGMVLYGDALLSYSTNANLDLELPTSDVLLLSSFVGSFKSLRSHDQSWVPICLPNYNSNAYLQAYICNIKLRSSIMQSAKQMSVSLVLIATSAESEVFESLHMGRQGFEESILQQDIPQRLLIAVESQLAYLSTYALPVYCIHFLYIARPQLGDSSNIVTGSHSMSDSIRQRMGVKSRQQSSLTPSQPQPAQCHCFMLEGSITAQTELNR